MGMWRKGIHQPGRHAFVPGRRHGDDANPTGAAGADSGDEGSWRPRRSASAPEAGMRGAASEHRRAQQDRDVEQATEPDAALMEPPPATAGDGRWWSEDEDTAVLPRLQDVQPPVRPTPIRRPPWVGGRHRADDEGPGHSPDGQDGGGSDTAAEEASAAADRQLDWRRHWAWAAEPDGDDTDVLPRTGED